MSLLPSSTSSCSDAVVALELLPSGYPAVGSLSAGSPHEAAEASSHLVSRRAALRRDGFERHSSAQDPVSEVSPRLRGEPRRRASPPDLRPSAFHPFDPRCAIARDRRFAARVPGPHECCRGRLRRRASCLCAVTDARARGLRLPNRSSLPDALFERRSDVLSSVEPCSLRHPSRCGTSRCARRHDQLGHPGSRRPWSWASELAWVRCPAVTAILRSMSASHDSICKERAPRVSVHSAPLPTRPGALGSRRVTRFGGPGAFTERSLLRFHRPGVPLTLRHRATHCLVVSPKRSHAVAVSGPATEQPSVDVLSIESARRPAEPEGSARSTGRRPVDRGDLPRST